MAESNYCPTGAMSPRPDRVGDKSIKVTAGSPLLTSKVRRNFKSNGTAPRNTQIRSSRK